MQYCATQQFVTSLERQVACNIPWHSLEGIYLFPVWLRLTEAMTKTGCLKRIGTVGFSAYSCSALMSLNKIFTLRSTVLKLESENRRISLFKTFYVQRASS